MSDETKVDLLQLKLDLQQSMAEGFEKVYERMKEEFVILRNEIKEDEESTHETRARCERRFRTLETWKVQKEVLNGHKQEEKKQRWDKNLAYKVVVTSALLAFLFDAIIKKVFG